MRTDLSMSDSSGPVAKDKDAHRSDTSRRAADDLFRIFEDMIMSGELQEGQTLPPEREIVQTYGVSRTVVREAVLALSNKGLVKARPRFRPIVSKPSFDTAMETAESVVSRLLGQPGGVKNLFDTRTMIEAALTREAAKHARKDDIGAMQDALAANGAAIDDSEAFYKTDMAFHAALYRVPNNPIYPAIHKAYTAWLAPQWSRMPRLPARNHANFLAHQAIFNAILLRDPDGAEAQLKEHLHNAWLQVCETFGDL